MKKALLSLSIAALIFSHASAQTTKYWDQNGGTTAGAGAVPNGTWSNGGGGWNTGSGGSTAATTWTNTTNQNARISAGTDATGGFTVTVSGNVLINQMGVEEGDPTFTGGQI